MNKLTSILSLAAVCIGFAACDDVEESLSKPQTNPQEPVMQVDGLAVQVPAATATTVDLKTYDNGQRAGLVPVLEISKLENFPETYTIKGEMKIGTDEDFTNSRTIPLVTDSLTLLAPVEDWETAHIELYTKNPRPAQSFVEINLYAVNGTAQVRLMNGDTFEFGERELTVTPLDALIPVEDAYYVVAGDKTIDMVPSNPENVYNPPRFSAVVEVGVGETINVMIKSETGKLYGVDASNEGKLVVDGSPIVLNHAGPRQITVNMETLAYDVSSAFPEIWAYSSTPANGYALTTKDYNNYSGFAGFTGPTASFRLASENVNAPAVQWGQAVDEDGNVTTGAIEEAETPAPIALPASGCYFIKANLSALTYSADKIEYFGLIGGWDSWAGDVVMTPTDSDHMVWTAELTITDGTEFKIRTNGDWEGANLGAGDDANPSDLANLTEHGANMVWEQGDGTFTVTLDLSSIPYSLTAVRK